MLYSYIVLGQDAVEVKNVEEAFEKSYRPYRLESDSAVVTCCSALKTAVLVRKRVAVLISGSGKRYLKSEQRLNHVVMFFC